MTDDYTIGKPLAELPSHPGRVSVWNLIAIDVREHPGQWVPVNIPGRPIKSLKVTATLIHRRHSQAPKPTRSDHTGHWDAAVRDGMFYLMFIPTSTNGKARP